jgi:hypothetical protein
MGTFLFVDDDGSVGAACRGCHSPWARGGSEAGVAPRAVNVTGRPGLCQPANASAVALPAASHDLRVPPGLGGSGLRPAQVQQPARPVATACGTMTVTPSPSRTRICRPMALAAPKYPAPAAPLALSQT